MKLTILFFILTISFVISRKNTHKRLKIHRTKGCNKYTPKSLPDVQKATIVLAHNLYRSMIASGKSEGARKKKLPKASDMKQMYWSDEIAKIAQSWADKCDFREAPENVKVYKNHTLGENLWTFATKGPLGVEQFNWDKAIHTWWSEITLFKIEDIFPFTKYKNKHTKEFSQVIWANSNLIGCGYSFYEEGGYNRQLYICLYGEEGNKKGRSVYTEGRQCSKCPEGMMCSNEWESLCCLQTKCGKNNWI